jgi:hypothetical protein
MSSPLLIVQEVIPHKFPQEILNIIQSFLKNDMVYQAIKEYYAYLYNKKEAYEADVYKTYIMPNCYCHRLRRNRDCSYCHEFEYTYKFVPQDWKCCIQDNPQFLKICYGEKEPHTDYNEADSCSYDYHYVDPGFEW